MFNFITVKPHPVNRCNDPEKYTTNAADFFRDSKSPNRPSAKIQKMPNPTKHSVDRLMKSIWNFFKDISNLIN